VTAGNREDIILKRKRAHGVIVYNDEPERRVIIKKRRHPSIAVVGETSRIVTRSHGGGDIRVRTSVRSRETTSGSAATVKRSQGSVSAASRGSLHSESSGQTQGAAASGNPGNAAAGNSRTTTGQGPNR
jgi:hypothetical protein